MSRFESRKEELDFRDKITSRMKELENEICVLTPIVEQKSNKYHEIYLMLENRKDEYLDLILKLKNM